MEPSLYGFRAGGNISPYNTTRQCLTNGETKEQEGKIQITRRGFQLLSSGSSQKQMAKQGNMAKSHRGVEPADHGSTQRGLGQ